MTRVIELDSTLYKDMVAQGLEEFPNEACGLLAAADGVPVKVFRMTNSDASPVSYRLDGKEQLQVFDEMETVVKTYGINTFKHFMAYKGALMVDDEQMFASFTRCAELGADLLVIGATGHSQLYERMIGSRADRLVHLAPCPVLVVK
jgi:nucleotide-binding universal stress UspA family protein